MNKWIGFYHYGLSKDLLVPLINRLPVESHSDVTPRYALRALAALYSAIFRLIRRSRVVCLWGVEPLYYGHSVARLHFALDTVGQSGIEPAPAGLQPVALPTKLQTHCRDTT